MDIAIDRIFDLVPGGRSAVAQHFGVSVEAVRKWRDTVPADKVIPLSALVRHEVTPHELRADLYPHPDDGLPAELRAQAAE